MLALPLALLLSAPARAEIDSDVRLLPAYFTGEFGSGIRTDITYIPLILTARTERQEFRLTVPFLSISTSEPVTFTGGEVIGGPPGGKGGRGSTTESGLGDVLVQEEVYFVEGSAVRPWISGIAYVKLPTADETKGLGTGQADYGPGAAIIQPLGRHLTLMADARYVFRGRPAGTDYRNTLWLSAGVQHRLSAVSSISLFYDDRQSVLSTRENLRDVSLGYDRHLSGSVVFRSAVYAGLSNTAEDFGFSAGFSFGARR